VLKFLTNNEKYTKPLRVVKPLPNNVHDMHDKNLYFSDLNNLEHLLMVHNDLLNHDQLHTLRSHCPEMMRSTQPSTSTS
jgi:hypothetical protein